VKRLGDYKELESLLEANDAQMSVAEAHGLASGMLCVQFDADFKRWLTAIFDTDDHLNSLSDDDQQYLSGLFEGTVELLKNRNFIFNLLLPDDDERIGVRAQALSEWCQGFLYGVAYMGAGDDKDWGEESRSVLRDLLEISRLDSDDSDDSDEQAFMELQEYVRAAVQLLLHDLQLSNEEQDEGQDDDDNDNDNDNDDRDDDPTVH
tara:strand:- start:1429 stop:2046 length:618 start_codon:yes stop_codon:yes gene_type:complete